MKHKQIEPNQKVCGASLLAHACPSSEARSDRSGQRTVQTPRDILFASPGHKLPLDRSTIDNMNFITHTLTFRQDANPS
jgi:hypothetical protein